jgi:DNA-directed RNA polymerase subunit F
VKKKTKNAATLSSAIFVTVPAELARSVLEELMSIVIFRQSIIVKLRIKPPIAKLEE